MTVPAQTPAPELVDQQRDERSSEQLDELTVEELVEEVSIDGMCGVY